MKGNTLIFSAASSVPINHVICKFFGRRCRLVLCRHEYLSHSNGSTVSLRFTRRNWVIFDEEICAVWDEFVGANMYPPTAYTIRDQLFDRVKARSFDYRLWCFVKVFLLWVKEYYIKAPFENYLQQNGKEVQSKLNFKRFQMRNVRFACCGFQKFKKFFMK